MQSVLSPLVGRLSDVLDRKHLASLPPLAAAVGTIISARARLPGPCWWEAGFWSGPPPGYDCDCAGYTRGSAAAEASGAGERVCACRRGDGWAGGQHWCGRCDAGGRGWVAWELLEADCFPPGDGGGAGGFLPSQTGPREGVCGVGVEGGRVGL